MNDYKLDGIGKITGGSYGDIEIDGIATIQSDITFNDMKACGIVNVNGTVDGITLEVDGIIRFKGNVTCSNILITGLVKAQSINSETLKGLLNGLHIKQIYSDKVDLEFKRYKAFNKKILVDGIYGADIKVNNTKNKLRKIKIKEIIADNIKLIGVKADVVRGKKIELIDCKVAEVIYNDSLINTNSKIKDEVKN